jgi:hypothetical protein
LRVGAFAGFLVAALVAVLPAPANAQQGGGDQSVAAAQARADAAANAYLNALIKSQQLDAEVVALEQSISQLEQRVAELREQARGRAVEAYKRSGSRVEVQLGDDATAMDAARRTVMLDRLNARDDAAAAKLRDARDDLRARHDDLKTVQQAQADVLARLKGEEERLNSELVAAQNARRGSAGSADRGIPTPVPVNYVARAGEHPQHNSAFLVCTRRIESGGNYQAYNGSGPYYGAYQFTQSTWNSTANHAGRGELVGVDPRDASEYDQDDMAWTLYQWKGNAPWNGRC